jgi:hypothetical protein
MKANFKTRISTARTKLIAVRKVVEADRTRRLEPLRQGFKRTAKLELDNIRDLTTKIIEKLSHDEEAEVLQSQDEEDQHRSE